MIYLISIVTILLIGYSIRFTNSENEKAPNTVKEDIFKQVLVNGNCGEDEDSYEIAADISYYMEKLAPMLRSDGFEVKFVSENWKQGCGILIKVSDNEEFIQGSRTDVEILKIVNELKKNSVP